MKKALLFYITTLCMVPLFAQPTWFTNPSSFDPRGSYIIGLGEGFTSDDASAIAKANLVSQITVNIRTDTNTANTSLDSEVSAFYTEYISQNIRLTSNEQLTNMQVVNQAAENDKYYIMVALNKQRMFSSLDSEMKALWNRIQTSMRNADRFRGDNNVVSALESYAQAQKQLSELLVKKYLYDIHATRPYTIGGMISDSDIENNVRELISTLSFEVIGGNQQTTHRGSILPQSVSFQVSARRPGGVRELLSGLPVQILYADGEVIGSGKTNFHGQYHAQVVALANNEDRGRVIIQIDPTNFPSFYNRIFRNKSAEAHFRVTEGPQLQTRLSVLDENANPIPPAISRITALLSNNNVIVQDHAPLFFRGTGTVKERKVVEGNNVPRFIVNVTVELTLGEVTTNSIISTIRGNGSGTSDRSEADAINLAYRNLSFNTHELSTIINKSRDFTVE